jgi:predicted RNase H-like HicB family nuclease/predicted RNA binding protein YcfA (HicA-like mRNA interferase family)
MPMKVREVIRLPERNGWAEMRSKGSHRHFKHPDQPYVIHRCRSGGQGTLAGNLERYTQESMLEMKLRRYPLIIEKTETGYSAYSPDVPGCAAAGDTVEETRSIFHDALVAHFEAMQEIGEPIPDAQSLVDYVEVAA